MTDEELQAITRLSESMIAAINDDGNGPHGMSMAAFIEQYVPKLLTEVDRLRAENAALTQEAQEGAEALLRTHRILSRTQAQNAAMRELVQRVVDVNTMSEWNLAGLADAARALLTADSSPKSD